MLVVQAAVLAAVLEEDQSNETALSEIFYGPGFVDFDVPHSPIYSPFVILDRHVLCSTTLVVCKPAESLRQ